MNKLSTIMLLAAFAFIGACASDDAVVKESEADDAAVSEQPAADTMRSDAQTEVKDSAADMTEDTGEMSSDTDTDTAAARSSDDEEEAEADTSASSDKLVSTCTYGGDTRVISVVYDNAETDTVCEVTYEKSSGVQTLWSANNERDYCLPKAKEFVEKQRGWGWECTDLQ